MIGILKGAIKGFFDEYGFKFKGRQKKLILNTEMIKDFELISYLYERVTQRQMIVGCKNCYAEALNQLKDYYNSSDGFQVEIIN